jgi:putative transposase
MTRQRCLRVVQRAEERRPRLQALKAEQPFWGDRRIWAYLRLIAPRPVNKKRRWRRMRAHHLLVRPNWRRKAKRTPQGRKPKPATPTAWWGSDMTEVLVAGVGWVAIGIGLDWATKAVVGHYAGRRGRARPGLEALDMAVNRQFPLGLEAKVCRCCVITGVSRPRRPSCGPARRWRSSRR